jgi:hypothetical protein
MNISAQFWGKGCWDFLYSVAYCNANLEKFIELLKLLQYLLPCDTCKQHYKEYIEKNPPSGDLKVWLNNLHNDINKRLEKQFISLESVNSIIEKHITAEVVANTAAVEILNVNAEILNVSAEVVANTTAEVVANVSAEVVANVSAEVVANVSAEVVANVSAEVVANVSAEVVANTIAEIINITSQPIQKVISEQNKSKSVSPGFQINHPVQKVIPVQAPVPAPEPTPTPVPKVTPAPAPAPAPRVIPPPPKKKGGCGCGR